MEQNPDLPDLTGLSEEEKIKLLAVIKKAKVIIEIHTHSHSLLLSSRACCFEVGILFTDPVNSGFVRQRFNPPIHVEC